MGYSRVLELQFLHEAWNAGLFISCLWDFFGWIWYFTQWILDLWNLWVLFMLIVLLPLPHCFFVFVILSLYLLSMDLPLFPIWSLFSFFLHFFYLTLWILRFADQLASSLQDWCILLVKWGFDQSHWAIDIWLFVYVLLVWWWNVS